MSYFKNNSDFNLYYSDTDSAVIDAKLHADLVGTELGQFKLEHTIKRGVFIAPKVYGFIDIDNKTTIKIKGVSDSISKDVDIYTLESVLIKGSSVAFNQERWFKNLLKGQILVKDKAYHLKVTSNKREAIYREYYENGKYENIYFADTKPYYYEDIEVKSKK